MTFDWIGAWQTLVVFGIPVTLVCSFAALSEDHPVLGIMLAVMFFALVSIGGGIPWEVA